MMMRQTEESTNPFQLRISLSTNNPSTALLITLLLSTHYHRTLNPQHPLERALFTPPEPSSTERQLRFSERTNTELRHSRCCCGCVLARSTALQEQEDEQECPSPSSLVVVYMGVTFVQRESCSPLCALPKSRLFY